jgi:hypothetical protein
MNLQVDLKNRARDRTERKGRRRDETLAESSSLFLHHASAAFGRQSLVFGKLRFD